MSSKTPAGRSTHRLPDFSPQLNATKQVNALSFQMGCKWVVWCCMPVVNPRQYYAAICQLLIRLTRYSSPAIHEHITSLASYCRSPCYLNEPDQLEWTRYDVSHVTCISICAQQLLYDHSCAADSKYVRPSWSETEQIEKEHGFVLIRYSEFPRIIINNHDFLIYLYQYLYFTYIYICIISWRVRSIFGQTHHGSTVQHVLRSRSTRNSLKRSDSMCPTSSISLKSIRCWQKCLVFSWPMMQGKSSIFDLVSIHPDSGDLSYPKSTVQITLLFCCVNDAVAANLIALWHGAHHHPFGKAYGHGA